jgi:hypothetical protein
MVGDTGAGPARSLLSSSPCAPSTAPDISRVAPRLWVGAAPDALDPAVALQQSDDVVARAALGLVVDCRLGADDKAVWARHREVAYINIGVEDAGTPLPDDFFTVGVELVFGHWARTQSSVLVHCESGAHRSPALALAVLLVDGFEPETAVRQLTAARPEIRDRYFADAARWHRSYADL